MVEAKYIEPESTNTIMVSCVENCRWELSEDHSRTARVPMSVMGASFNLDRMS